MLTSEVLTLIILIFYSEGGFDRELRPVTVPVCQTVKGKRVEDESCGLRACLREGRIRAAQIATNNPVGQGFGLMCKRDNGETAREGAEPSPGHGGSNWQ